MEGRTLSHFRILEKIGAGGMGVVYRAHDERLDRDVALKVLPPGLLSDDSARRRFRKEALALSRLNHPNIETIHDFDTQEGVDFLVMEYIPGQTLAEKLAGGPLPEKEVAALGAQIASALEGAHERGVVHRDLKPGNILVTPKKQVKVLDFGLAMLLRPVGAASQTETLSQAHAVVGTLPYMAPEQLRGEDVDARSDIYAAGAVLFEMATRQRPFPQKSAPGLIDAIQHEAPPTPSTINRWISPTLDGIILKALDKDPNRRYQSARELLVDLERLGAPVPAVALRGPLALRRWWPLVLFGASLVAAGVLVGLNVGGMRDRLLGRGAPGRIDSLAVLPLVNLSDDPEQEYFADGMTEVLITDLARISTLRVISRSSVMSFKGARGLMPEIGRKLGVDAVVSGAVLRSGERVRITAQLVEAATDRHLWASTYERDVRDVLRLQAEVAEAIAKGIQARLTPQEQARLRFARSVDPEAYQDYLKGLYFQNWRTEEGSRKSLEHFQRAIERDPTYALAYVGLSDTYQLLSFYGVLPPGEAHLKGKVAVQKALEIDGSLAEARTSLAGLLNGEWDWAGAEREFKAAIELNPNYARAHHWYADMLMYLGRLDESLTEIRRAQELDPLSPIIAMIGGEPFYYVSRDYDRAIEQYRKALDLDPKFAITHGWLGLAYMEKKEYEAAIAEIQKAIDLSGRDPRYLAFLCQVHARAGERDTAQRLLGELLDRSKERYVSPWDIALTYASLGESDQAFALLEKGYQERADLMLGLKVDPRLDSLRSDPRFKDLLRRVGLPPD